MNMKKSERERIFCIKKLQMFNTNNRDEHAHQNKPFFSSGSGVVHLIFLKSLGDQFKYQNFFYSSNRTVHHRLVHIVHHTQQSQARGQTCSVVTNP
jgi:hypothetical protein